MILITLPEVVDAAAADGLQGRLLEQKRRRNACRIDGAAVERIGTAGLQILWAAQLSFAAQGLEFDLAPRSPALDQALVLAGLNGPEHFNLISEPQ